MTGNHLMLLLFSSVLSILSVCRDSRCRVQQSSLIGHSIDIWLYCLPFLVGRIRIYPIPAHNEGVASECSSKFYYVCILLDPVINVYQRRSTLRFCTLHESRDVYPAMVWLYLQLKVCSVRTRYCTGLIPAFRVCIKYVLSWKKNSSSDRPCLNKAFLSSISKLCNLRKCLCHIK